VLAQTLSNRTQIYVHFTPDLRIRTQPYADHTPVIRNLTRGYANFIRHTYAVPMHKVRNHTPSYASLRRSCDFFHENVAGVRG